MFRTINLLKRLNSTPWLKFAQSKADLPVFAQLFALYLLDFVGLFSVMCFQMSVQVPCVRGCKITLVAFVGLFSTVCFQIFPQIAYINGCIITLVAFI